MKTINTYITEKLHINKNTKPTIELDIKGETVFTQEEIDEIYDFADSLKIKPVIITNQYVKDPGKSLSKEDKVIFLHFYDEWETIPPYRKADEIKDKSDRIVAIRFAKHEYCNNYAYNCLTNKHHWLYATASTVNSCKEGIDCMKNDFAKKYKDYI